jgi:hypothetical protein
MRTTVDIDDPVLREIKTIHKQEGRAMGTVISALLADALAIRRAKHSPVKFHWTSRAMKSRIDIADKDALYRALDSKGRRAIRSM